MSENIQVAKATTAPTPTIGRIVLYKLTQQDAGQINRRRADAREKMPLHGFFKTGAQVHVGNAVDEGQIFPMMIVEVHGGQFNSLVNGQVFLDGNDVLWATSVGVAADAANHLPGEYVWPGRA